MPQNRLLSSSDSEDSAQSSSRGVTFDPHHVIQTSSVSSQYRARPKVSQEAATADYLNQRPSHPAVLSGRGFNGRNPSSETSSEARDPQTEVAASDFSDFQQSTESGSDSFQEGSYYSRNLPYRFVKSQNNVVGSVHKKNEKKSLQRDFEDLLQKYRKSHLMKIHQTFIRLWRTGTLCDIILKTADAQIPVHSAVVVEHSGLCERESRSFRSTKTLPIIINLPGKLPTKAVLLVVDFIYLAKLQIDLATIVSIHQVARQMEVYVLMARCTKILDRLLEDQNVVQTIQAATEFGIEDLQQIAWSSFTKDFKVFCSRSSFQEQNLQTVVKLLSADHLLIKSEFEVFEAAMTWINHRKMERTRHLARLMDCVRLIHMTDEELINCLQYDSAFSTSPGLEILAEANMKKMLRERGELPADFALPPNRTKKGHHCTRQTESAPTVSSQPGSVRNWRPSSPRNGPPPGSPFAVNRPYVTASASSKEQDFRSKKIPFPSPSFLLPEF